MNLPKGFYFAGVNCGITEHKKDLGLVYSEVPATAAGLFTTNKVKAAPVMISQHHLKNGKVRALIVNSGNANACVKNGLKNASRMAEQTAKYLGIKEAAVLVASTGIIGMPLPMNKIIKGIKQVTAQLPGANLGDFAEAIMTTDTVPKIARQTLILRGKKISLLGVAKGAGMVSPHFATLLCFLTTDLNISRRLLKIALRRAAKISFNQITIDGDLSTNDSLLCLANGLAKNKIVNTRGKTFAKFQTALNRLCINLARQIVLDGEGATKLVEIEVAGVRRLQDAEKLCHRVASSLLVKTALFGESPNWGRIMVALGDSGVKIEPQRIEIFLANKNKIVKLVRKGYGTRFDLALAKRILHSPEIKLKIHLHQGSQKAKIFTTDLSDKYVKINAGYN